MSREINGINNIPTILDQNKTNGINEFNEEKLLSFNKDESILNNTIRMFYDDKQQLDYYKKATDKSNKEIKELMQQLDTEEFETDNGLIAKMSIQNRESFNEEKLITKLKELNVTAPIKTIEVIDYEALEDVIYNNILDATKITDCKQSKEVITLKVTKKKGE